MAARNNNKGERGSALVLVLIFCAALLILGGALSTLTLNDNFIAANQVEDSRLYYITEAGIEAGVAAVSRYFNYSDEIEGQLDGGGYETEVVWGPTLSAGHRYYNMLKDVQINPMDERLIISTGRLGDREMAMAVIVKLHPLVRKALMVSDKLEIEDSIIYGNVHANEMVKIKGTNLIIGELAYTLFDKSSGWTGENPSITIRQKVNPTDPECEEYFETTYSVSNNFTNDMQAPEVKVPPINFNNFLRKVNCTYPLKQTWNVTAHCYDCDVILVKGDLDIKPNNGQTIELSEKVIIVEGNLVIAAQKDATANLHNCVFVVYGTTRVEGSVNREITDPDSNMVLFVSNGDIDVTKVITEGGIGEENMFFGGRLLLFSKSDVRIGDPSLKNEFDMYGTIIAEQASLLKCRLHYIPDIFDEYGDMLGIGVVMQEWIKPWRPQ